MLSAIAARKAAQAAKVNAATQEVKKDITHSQKSPVAPEAPSKNVKASSSKRKPSTSSHQSTQKKKKRKAPVESRYYELNSDSNIRNEVQESFEIEEEAGAAVESYPESSSEEDGMQLAEGSNTYQSRRAWSPSQPILDSSGDERVDMDSTADMVQYKSKDTGYQNMQRLSFIPQENVNIFSCVDMKQKTGTLVILKEGEKMAILGVYTLQVLQGTISFLGSSLHASFSPFTVFAPRCSPIPILTASKRTLENRDLSGVPDIVLQFLKPEDTLVMFEEASVGVEGLQTVCRTFDGIFNTRSQQDDVLALKSASLVSISFPKIIPKLNTIVLQLTALPPSLQPFKLPTSWETAFNNPSLSEETYEPPVILIKGPKRTGKSTAARTLLNTLLNKYKRVALLDCDIGQTEFTPPGIVSLNLVEIPLLGRFPKFQN